MDGTRSGRLLTSPHPAWNRRQCLRHVNWWTTPTRRAPGPPAAGLAALLRATRPAGDADTVVGLAEDSTRAAPNTVTAISLTSAVRARIRDGAEGCPGGADEGAGGRGRSGTGGGAVSAGPDQAAIPGTPVGAPRLTRPSALPLTRPPADDGPHPTTSGAAKHPQRQWRTAVVGPPSRVHPLVPGEGETMTATTTSGVPPAGDTTSGGDPGESAAGGNGSTEPGCRGRRPSPGPGRGAVGARAAARGAGAHCR